MCDRCKAFRIGIVESVDASTHTVRVHYQDSGKVSHPLQVLAPCAHREKSGILPDIGDQVFVIELPPTYQIGFVLGAMYSEVDKPASADHDKKVIKISDGASIEIDRKTHAITINALTDLSIEAVGAIRINGSLVTINDKPVAPGPKPIGA